MPGGSATWQRPRMDVIQFAGEFMDERCRAAIVVSALLVVLTSPRAEALQTDVPQSRGNATPARDAQLLVLVDGKVVRGRLTPRPDGYDVATTAGRMFISSDRVRFTAHDLDEACQLMRETQATQTPEGHMELARWCLANKLPDDARRELLDALRLDPNRGDAMRLLATLESRPESAAPTRSATIMSNGRHSASSPIESRSLAGLSRNLAQDFTRRIQPLMMNKCATSGCHGPSSTSGFQLQSAHHGSSATVAERNLAALLRQIDLTNPDQSPLLTMADEQHGQQSAPAFRGRAGALTRQNLRSWVMSVAEDIGPKPGPAETGTRSARIRPATIMQNHDASATGELEAGAEQSLHVPHGRLVSTAETDRQFVARARRSLAADQFSPDEFNRLHHAGVKPRPLRTEPDDPHNNPDDHTTAPDPTESSASAPVN